MLTVEIRDPNDVRSGKAEIEIYCDAEGLATLFRYLEHLKAGSTHVHFMTPAWAGTELGEKPVGKGTELINHLRITMLPVHPGT
jgi:hypothetical protein